MARIINGLDSELDLEVLVEFENASWPEEEQASGSMLQRRLEEFPEGIWVLLDRDKGSKEKAMAQFTVVPKIMPDTFTSFEQMRDLPVERSGDTLWGVNISKRQGKAYQSKLYACLVVEECFRWARQRGYQKFMAGVTCCGLRNSGMTPEEYVAQGRNPALRVFQRAADKLGMKLEINEIIPNYWEIDEDSLGMGVLITVHFKES